MHHRRLYSGHVRRALDAHTCRLTFRPSKSASHLAEGGHVSNFRQGATLRFAR